MGETVVLDPPAIAVDRSQLELTKWVGKEGPDWGDAAVARQLAQTPLGDLPVGDPRWPNRQIQIPLSALRSGVAQTFGQVRTQLQQKVGLFQSEGGWVQRMVGSTPLYAEVIGATLKLGGGDAQALFDVDPDARLVLDALPHWLEDEVTSGPFNGVGAVEFTLANLRGSVPGPLRLRLKNNGGTDASRAWESVLYSLDDPGATLRLTSDPLAASRIDPRGAASAQADTFASGGWSIALANVPLQWVAATLSTSLTHKGTYRVLARVRDTASVASLQLALECAVGGNRAKARRNPASGLVTPAIDANFGWADLGEVRLDRKSLLSVLARRTVLDNSTIRIDCLELVRVDKAAAIVFASDPPAPSDFSGRDGFTAAAGAMAGRSADFGGVWSGYGDATDGTVDIVNRRLGRTDTADAAGLGGARLWRLSTSIPSVSRITLGFELAALPTDLLVRLGGFLRFVDINNFCAAFVEHVGSTTTLRIAVRLAGVDTMPKFPIASLVAARRYALSFWIDADGKAKVRLRGGGDWRAEQTVTSLATGGALDDGGIGILDQYLGTQSISRYYREFGWDVPDLETVRLLDKVEINGEGAIREVETGLEPTITPLLLDGEAPLIAPGGMEGRDTRIRVVTSRGRIGETLDGGSINNQIEVTAHTRGAHLFVPEPTP